MAAATPYYNGIGAKIIAYAPDNQKAGMLDCVTIQYNESQNKLPVYGYKSFLYDEMLYGDILVQGTFLLNKNSSITMHNYIAKNSHPETENFVVKFGSDESLLTQSKFIIQVKHNSEVLEADPTYVSKKYKIVFTIEDVELTGIRHAIQADGNPIGEFYDFIGKRVGDTPAILQESV